MRTILVVDHWNKSSVLGLKIALDSLGSILVPMIEFVIIAEIASFTAPLLADIL